MDGQGEDRRGWSRMVDDVIGVLLILTGRTLTAIGVNAVRVCVCVCERERDELSPSWFDCVVVLPPF